MGIYAKPVGDRLKVGLRVLVPPIGVRIPIPQPGNLTWGTLYFCPVMTYSGMIFYNIKKLLASKYVSIILFQLAFLPLILVSILRKKPFFIYYEQLSIWQHTFVLLSIIALVVLYLYFIKKPSKILDFPTKKIILILSPLLISLVSIPPLLSRDILSYLLPARNLIVYGASPYLTLIQDFQQNPWTSYVKDIYDGTTIYGPLFNLLMSIFFVIKTDYIYVYVLLFKLFLLGLFLLDIFLITKICAQLNLSLKVVRLFILNPAILIHIIMEAHNDSIMLTLILASIYFFYKKQAFKSYTLLIISVGIKYLPLMLIPAFWFRNKVFQYKNVFISIVLAFLIGVPTIYIFPGFLEKFFSTAPYFASHCIYSCMIITTLVNYLFPDIYIEVLRVSFILVWLYCYYRFIYTKSDVLGFITWAFLAFNLFVMAWVTPWALTIPLSFAIVQSDKKPYLYLTAFLTFYSLFRYFVIFVI